MIFSTVIILEEKKALTKQSLALNEKVGSAILVGIKEFIKAKLGGKFAITNF